MHRRVGYDVSPSCPHASTLREIRPPILRIQSCAVSSGTRSLTLVRSPHVARPPGTIISRMRPVALITGTSSGMGLHAAVELARREHTVVATMRDVSKRDDVERVATEAGVNLDVRALDVLDHDAVDDVVRRIVRDHGPIDVLINNAGRGAVSTAEQLSIDDVRDQLELNYVAPIALAKAVIPSMRERGTGRILTITSVGGAVGQPFADAYCGAKFAVEGFMQSLAVVLGEFGVWVSVIEPGAVATEFVSNVLRPRDVGAYEHQLNAYIARSRGSFASAQSAHDAGLAIVEAATSEHYRFRWQTSSAATAFVATSLADVDGARVAAVTSEWIR